MKTIFTNAEIIKITKEVAEHLNCGNKVYIHKITKELIAIPDMDEMIELDLEAWDEELEMLNNNYDDYFEIEKWSSNEAFDVMLDFANNLNNNTSLQKKLFDALDSKKPFREFKYTIDNSGPYRQIWFDFKDQYLQEFVLKQLKRLE